MSRLPSCLKSLDSITKALVRAVGLLIESEQKDDIKFIFTSCLGYIGLAVRFRVLLDFIKKHTSYPFRSLKVYISNRGIYKYRRFKLTLTFGWPGRNLLYLY